MNPHAFQKRINTRYLHFTKKVKDEIKEEKIKEEKTSKDEKIVYRSSEARPVTWTGLALTLLIGGSLVFIFQKIKNKKDKALLEKQNKSVGKAQVGGPFTLVDHNGRPVTDGTYRGKFLLIYFGFTHCPDICPTELRKLSQVLDNIEKEGLGDLMQPLFITVDPLRDTVAQVRTYVQEFHPKMIGLTGTPEQIQRVCRSYRVYYSKASENEGLKEDDDYVLDHSIFVYMMDTDGELLDYFGMDHTEERMTKKISEHLHKFIDSKIPQTKPWYKLF